MCILHWLYVLIISRNTCLAFGRFRIRRKKITWFISVIIPQTASFFLVILLYSSKLYIAITTSKSSALWINTLFIFEMLLINGALSLNAALIFFVALFGLLTITISFTKNYASEKLLKSALNIIVLFLISLLALYSPFDWS